MAETVSRRAISRGWDGLLRLGASVKYGRYPATEVLDRFGSAAAGDPVFEAGDELGKLLRSLYLCDFLSNPVFRTDILDLPNQGEAVHSLQRAIHNGGITAKHGRTTEQLGAISGALTLLANIIMAWNTHRMQAVIDQAPTNHPDEVLSRMAGSVSIRASRYRLWSRERDQPLLCGLQDAQHRHAPAQEPQAALEGGDVLVAAGARAKVVAQFVVALAEPGR